MTKLPIPSGWNKRVQSAILQAISLSRHCFVASVHVKIDFLHGRKHLPIVTLKHAA